MQFFAVSTRLSRAADRDFTEAERVGMPASPIAAD